MRSGEGTAPWISHGVPSTGSRAPARSVTGMDEEPMDPAHLLLTETGACAIVGYD